MTIQEKVKSSLKHAIMEKNDAQKSILRVLIGEFDRIDKTVTDEQATAVIKKMVQNAYDQNNSDEALFLEKYLPKQLTDDQLQMLISDLVEEHSIDSMKGMGIIMGALKKEFPGQYDGKVASQLIKATLS